jgi:lactate dehydrogenase-like 2-hydroxyacid dehydrogenase
LAVLVEIKKNMKSVETLGRSAVDLTGCRPPFRLRVSRPAHPAGITSDQEKTMAGEKADILLLGPPRPLMVEGLAAAATVHRLADTKDREAFLTELAPRVRGIAVSAPVEPINEALMSRFPRLEIVASFGVGYDHVDAKWAGAHGITVTNTPDVLTEEVADTALGLLLCTVREFPQAERYLRAGKWLAKAYPLSKATLRNRIVGMVGMGRIGKAIARRLDAFGVPVVYHSRNPQAGVPYRYYPDLIAMARDVGTLMVIVPGGAATQKMINAAVLEALGPNGILINMARGSVVDEPALIKALKERKIMSAGLDVFANEPVVPNELLEMEHVVLFPHLGSASVATRRAMDQLVVDNLLAWAAGKPPLTPVEETPWPPKR